MSSVWCLADGCLAYGVFTDFLSGASVYIFSYYIYQIFFLHLRSHITRRFIIHAQLHTYTHIRPVIWNVMEYIWCLTQVYNANATSGFCHALNVTSCPPGQTCSSLTGCSSLDTAAGQGELGLENTDNITDIWPDWCCQICWRVPCPCPPHSGSAVLWSQPPAHRGCTSRCPAPTTPPEQPPRVHMQTRVRQRPCPGDISSSKL